MKKTLLPFVLTSVFFCVNAQEKGMHFEHNTSWKSILAKAKAEDKYIFLDCYTTWCGPCKMMSTDVFTNNDVGEYYNTKFVNAEVQMDKTNKDDEYIKSWYATSNEIENKYGVTNYPTYLIFNPEGEIVHRFVGSMDADVFLNIGKDLIIPEKQYYTQLRKYFTGVKSNAFLYQLVIMSQEARDMKNARAILDDYLLTQKNLYTKENLDFVKNFINSSKDKGFTMMMQDPHKVDSILGKGISEKTVNNIIFREEVMPKLFPEHVLTKTMPNWVTLKNDIAIKYTTKAAMLTDYAKVVYYQEKAECNNSILAVIHYIKLYGSEIPPNQLNDFAAAVFQNCNAITSIKSALKWSKQAVIKEDNNFQFIDTYANLLMKAGKKQEAIDWETKAVALAKKKNYPGVGEYEETLSTMKK